MSDLTVDDILAASPHGIEPPAASEVRRLAALVLEDLRQVSGHVSEDLRGQLLVARARLRLIVTLSESALVGDLDGDDSSTLDAR